MMGYPKMFTEFVCQSSLPISNYLVNYTFEEDEIRIHCYLRMSENIFFIWSLHAPHDRRHIVKGAYWYKMISTSFKQRTLPHALGHTMKIRFQFLHPILPVSHLQYKQILFCLDAADLQTRKHKKHAPVSSQHCYSSTCWLYDPVEMGSSP